MGVIITDLSAPISSAGDTLARNLIARLNAAYPAFEGYWTVMVNEQGGVIEVMNLMLSGKWGFLMHINKIDAEGRKVVRAAGELLERYKISRSAIKSVAMQSLSVAPRNRFGELVADCG